VGARFVDLADRRLIEENLLRFVRVHSVNPGIDGGPGEAELATEIEREMAALGLNPQRQTVADGGRDNIVGRLEGAPGSPVVMFEAHLDTVGLSGTATTKARSHAGRVYGRGACDTKGSLTAMLEGVRLLAGLDPSRRPTVVMVGSIDEEFAGTGAETLSKADNDIDMAVVGEPTGLEVATAHKGVLRFEIAVHGRPAHSSKPYLGVNAISAMAPVVLAIESEYVPRLQDVVHPLVGSPTLNVSTIRGGTAQNIVPAECVIAIDRRVNPGENPEAILAEVDSLLESLPSGEASFERSAPTLVTSPLDTPTDHPLVVALQSGQETVLGERGQPMGMTFGTDASLFGPSGIPCVVFGPGSIDQAHSDEEWVEVEDVAKAAEILAEAMTALI
jgi:succinyl-diaminopimelate desuccinylase